MTNPIDPEELELRKAVRDAEKAVEATRFVTVGELSIEALLAHESAVRWCGITKEDLARYLRKKSGTLIDDVHDYAGIKW